MTLHRLPDPPLTAEEFARAIGKDAKSVRALIEAGMLPGYRAGRNFIVPREAFERFCRGEWVAQPKPIRASDLVQRRKTA